MERVIEWAKEHWKLTLALVVGLVLLLWLRARSAASSAGANTTPYGGLSDSAYLSLQEANLQASTQLQAQTNQISAQVAGFHDQLQANEQNNAAAVTIAGLQSQDTLAKIAADQTVSIGSQQVQVDIAQLEQQATIEQTQAQAQISLASIEAQQSLYGVLARLAGGIGAPPVAQPITAPTSPQVTSTNPQAPPPGHVATSAGAVFSGGTTQPAAVAPADIYGQIFQDQTLGANFGAVNPSYVLNPFFSNEQQLANQPGVAHTYPDESAAIAAGALVLSGGRYVPSVSGAQITY